MHEYTEGWEDDCEGIEVNHSGHIKTTSQGRHTKKNYQIVARSILHLLVHPSPLGTPCMLTFVVLIFINLVASEDTLYLLTD